MVANGYDNVVEQTWMNVEAVRPGLKSTIYWHKSQLKIDPACVTDIIFFISSLRT